MKRNVITYILTILFFLIGFIGCNSEKARPDTPPNAISEIAEKVLARAAESPDEGWLLIDSLTQAGLPHYEADLLRASIYSKMADSPRLDSAVIIGERLMQLDVARDNLLYRQDVLEVLVGAARQLEDYELQLHWGMELADVCRRQGDKVDALRTEADLAAAQAKLGKEQEALDKLGEISSQLSAVRQFNELDADIIALKRKIAVLSSQSMHAEIITTAQHIIDRLADYEQHPADFHDDSYREPADDECQGYIDFYRSQAYSFLANAYANMNELDKARHYIALFEQSPLSKSLSGKKLIAPTLRLLGEYDKMEAIYRDLEVLFRQRGDSLTPDYAMLLRDRALAAEAQGRLAESNALWQQQTEVMHQVSERLLRGKSHLYAARFQSQEQQLQIERQQATNKRLTIWAAAISVIALLVLAFAGYAIAQQRRMQRKVHVLAHQIAEAIKYKDKYEAVLEESKFSKNAHFIDSATPDSTSVDQMNAEELFLYIQQVVKREQLFLNPSFDRQAVVDFFHLSKERVGAAFAQGSSYHSVADFIRDLRLEYACRLLVTNPQMSISDIVRASGFSNASVFSRDFKNKYELPPTVYRQEQIAHN